MKTIRGGIVALALLLCAEAYGGSKRTGPEPLAPDEVPQSGNFYSMQRTNQPPLPFCPIPDADLYFVDANTYLYNDLDVDYVRMEQEAMTLDLLNKVALGLLTADSGVPTPPGAGGGGMGEDPASGDPPPAYDYPPGSLWIEIHGVTNGLAYLTVHGTETGVEYQLQSRPSLDPAASWSPERQFYGEDGDTVLDPVPLVWRPMLFFRVARGGGLVVSIERDRYFPQAVEPNATIPDPGQDGLFQVRLSTVVGTNLVVAYQISGTASNGVDYTTLPGTVTIPAGTAGQAITIHPIADNLIEFDEPATLTLLSSPNYLVDPTKAAATLQVCDNFGSNIFQIVTTNLDWPVALDYYAPSNALAVSYNYNWNNFAYPTNNFGLMGTNRIVTAWTGVAGVKDEVKIATVKPGAIAFTNGVMFYGAGSDELGNCLIGRVAPTPAGLTWTDSWCVLTNESDSIRGSMYVDQTGIWGGDLVLVTGDEGVFPVTRGVWRVNSNGLPQQVVRIPTAHLEGAIILPDDVGKWGPWAGRLVTGDETLAIAPQLPRPLIFTIDTSGTVTTHALDIQPEDFDLIKPDEDLYCTSPRLGILKLPRSWFVDYVGDLLVTQAGEYFPQEPKLFIVHWDGSSFVTRSISLPSSLGDSFEHVTFAPVNVPAIPQ